jgi:hypothetical protein
MSSGRRLHSLLVVKVALNTNGYTGGRNQIRDTLCNQEGEVQSILETLNSAKSIFIFMTVIRYV